MNIYNENYNEIHVMNLISHNGILISNIKSRNVLYRKIKNALE